MLLALGPQSLGHSHVAVQESLLLFLNSNQVENTTIGVHTASVKRLVLPLSNSPLSRTRMPLSQQQHTAVGQDILIYGEALFFPSLMGTGIS